MKKIILLSVLLLGGMVFSCSTDDPIDDSVSLVWISDTGEKYHLQSCRYVTSNFYSIEKSEAISRGYTACKVCKP
jgi:hypothetical protein